MFASLATFTLLSLSSLAAGQAANCVRNYTVVTGDTCALISAKTDTSTFQLGHVNIFINLECTNLALGPICLAQKGQDCRSTSVVQTGDGCDTLAAAAGISKALLLHNNPNINAGCTNLGIGTVVCTTGLNITYT